MIITVFVLVTSVVARAIERRMMHVESIALSTRIGITKFTYFFLVGLGVLLGINAAGVDLTALTVLTGAVGLGLGFGLQSIASNFVSGFVLLMDKSIKPGDVISFTGMPGTSTESFGWVQALRGRYVVVRDRDGVETLVPNQQLITNPVINWSYSDRKVRLKLPVRVSYRDDPEQALAVLMRAAEGQCAHLARSGAGVTPDAVLRSRHGSGAALLDRRSRRRRQQRPLRRQSRHLAAVPRCRHHHPGRPARDLCPAWRAAAVKHIATIPDQDLQFQFVRGSGPGGQNVNKVATAAQLRFDLAGTRSLAAPVKARLRAHGRQPPERRRHAADHRPQSPHPGRQSARGAGASRGADRARHVVPKKRHATRPTLGSRQRRLDHKRERKQVKRLRGRVGDD